MIQVSKGDLAPAMSVESFQRHNQSKASISKYLEHSTNQVASCLHPDIFVELKAGSVEEPPITCRFHWLRELMSQGSAWYKDCSIECKISWERRERSPVIRSMPVLVVLILLLVPSSGALHSQEAQRNPVGPWCPAGLSARLDQLGLTEDQWSVVRRIERTCEERIHALQGRLMSRRLELQSLFRDALADGASVRAKAQEALDLQHECRRIIVDCQIDIREALTPGQRRDWSAAEDGCMPWNRRIQP